MTSTAELINNSIAADVEPQPGEEPKFTCGKCYEPMSSDGWLCPDCLRNREVKQTDRSAPGYICDCKFGSPRPGTVVFRSDLHSRDCPIRRKIVDKSNGYNTMPFPFNDE